MEIPNRNENSLVIAISATIVSSEAPPEASSISPHGGFVRLYQREYHVHRDFLSIDLTPIHVFDGFVGFFVSLELDIACSARYMRVVPLHVHIDVTDRP